MNEVPEVFVLQDLIDHYEKQERLGLKCCKQEIQDCWDKLAKINPKEYSPLRRVLNGGEK